MDRPQTVHIVRTEQTAKSSNNEHCQVKIRVENSHCNQYKLFLVYFEWLYVPEWLPMLVLIETVFHQILF